MAIGMVCVVCMYACGKNDVDKRLANCMINLLDLEVSRDCGSMLLCLDIVNHSKRPFLSTSMLGQIFNIHTNLSSLGNKSVSTIAVYNVISVSLTMEIYYYWKIGHFQA